MKFTDHLQGICNKVYQWVPQPEPSPSQREAVKIVAHRGAWNRSTRLENTMAAFLACLSHPIWAIEFDLHWTLDDVPVVHHDSNTCRVFQKNMEIKETLFSELRHNIPQIPTLKEVVDACAPQLHLMIELKTFCTVEQIKVLQQTLAPLEAVRDYHFMSLELGHFDSLAEVDKKAFVSIARTNINSLCKTTISEKFGGLTGQYLLLTDSMKNQCCEQKIFVGTGFSDSKNLLFREVNRGINWVFTNKAIAMARLLKNS